MEQNFLRKKELMMMKIDIDINKNLFSSMSQITVDFNGMSTCLGLFYALRLGNCIHLYLQFCIVISYDFFFFFFLAHC